MFYIILLLPVLLLQEGVVVGDVVGGRHVDGVLAVGAPPLCALALHRHLLGFEGS